MRVHEVALRRIAEAIRTYEANGRVTGVEHRETAAEAEAVESLRESARVLELDRDVDETAAGLRKGGAAA